MDLLSLQQHRAELIRQAADIPGRSGKEYLSLCNRIDEVTDWINNELRARDAEINSIYASLGQGTRQVTPLMENTITATITELLYPLQQRDSKIPVLEGRKPHYRVY